MKPKYRIERWRHPNGSVWFRLKVREGRWPFYVWNTFDSYVTQEEAELVIRERLIREPIRESTAEYTATGREILRGF